MTPPEEWSDLKPGEPKLSLKLKRRKEKRNNNPMELEVQTRNIFGKKVKKLRRELREKLGRVPREAQFNVIGNVVEKDEFRKFKREQEYEL